MRLLQEPHTEIEDYMTQTERTKIETIINYCKEDNPQAIKPLMNSLIASRISHLLDQKRDQIKKEI